MATKEDVRLEKEYQETLKVSSSALSAMQKDIQQIIDSKRNLNAQTKKYLKNLKDSSKYLTDSESINKQILKNQEEITKYKNGEYNVSKSATATAIKALEVQNASLGVYGKQQEAIEQVKKRADGLTSTLGGWVDKLSSAARSIPFLGGLIGGFADKAGNKLKAAFGTANQKYVAAYGKSIQSGAGHLKSMAKAGAAAGGGLLKAFMGPQAILLLLIGALAAGFYAIKQFEKGMKAFREETGLVKGQMDGIESTAAGIGAATMHLTGDIAEGAKVVGQMVAGFGSIERLSNETLKNAATLSLSYGIGAEHIAASNKLFQNMNGLTEEQAQYMTTNVAKMAEIADVSPQNVLKDMNESSAEMYKYFRGSPKELMKAAVQAQKLGTSLKQSAEVSKTLLNFEDSINSELEASAILGRNLNFNEARFKAAKGDTLGAQQAIMKEVGKLGDLTKLNVYQQEALAKATGMPIEDLINQQRIKKTLGKMSEEDLKLMKQLEAKGVDVTKMTEKQARAALAKQKIENRNVEATEVLENSMKAMMLNLAKSFAPLAEMLMNFLNKNMPEIQAFIKGTSEFLKSLVGGIKEGFAMISPFIDKIKVQLSQMFGGGESMEFMDILKKVGHIIGVVLTGSIQTLFRQFSAVLNMVDGVYKIVKGLFTLDFSMLGEGIKQAFSGYVEFVVAAVETTMNVLANLFPEVTFFQDLQTGFNSLIEQVKGLPELIYGYFVGLGAKLKGIFTNILPGWALEALGITPEVSGGGGLQPGGAVNDGVIQAGKIISTNPEDTLIATKQPGGLLDGIMSKVGGLFGGGEDGESGLSSAFNSIAEVLTTSLKGITSMVSGTGSEGGVAGISAEALQNTVLKMSSETLETKLDSLAEIQMNGATALTNAMLSLVDTLKATDIETNKKMIEKLEEVRKAVIIGSLIEMDGNILTQTVTQKQEAFNRVNFASRLKS
jgi:hypothetical protein